MSYLGQIGVKSGSTKSHKINVISRSTEGHIIGVIS